MRALLVEDDSVHAKLICRALEECGPGHTVNHVSDGDIAIEYLFGEGEFADRQRYPLPDVILLDLKMPRPVRVLVVDDDPCMRQVLKKHFKAASYEVWAAADGVEALTLFAEKSADVVILDINLPDMDGFEVCHSIKWSRDIPVIFVCGEQNRALRECLPRMVSGAGAEDVLLKPLDCNALMAAVERVVAVRPLAPPRPKEADRRDLVTRMTWLPDPQVATERWNPDWTMLFTGSRIHSG